MTPLSYEMFSEALRDNIPGFDQVCAQHVADYDGFLPHVLLGDLTRFLMSIAKSNAPEDKATLRSGMSLLEHALASSDPRLQELVVVSFLENLDRGSATFPVLRALFGPRLESEWNRLQAEGE